MLKPNPVLLLAFCGFFSAFSQIGSSRTAQAATPLPLEGPRLIQTESGLRSWMTPDQVVELALKAHREGHCGGFMDITEHPDKIPVFNRNLGIFENPVPRYQGWVNHLMSRLSTQRLVGHVEKLSSYPTRFLRSESGAEAARWIRDEFLKMARGRNDVTAELFTHRFLQPSVIVRIAGRGPRAAERVILGAHEDSVNWSTGWPSPKEQAPGADDDASGVSTLLETFQVLMDSGFRPDRTIEFIAYAGEELGLLGSQDIAEKYKKDGVRVAGVLQLDMTLYPGPDGMIHFVNDHTDRPLTQFTEMLVDTYVKVPWQEMPCKYACSDHASWTEAGYASAFPFEATMDQHNPNLHTERDTVSQLTPSFGLHFAKLAMAFAVELAGTQ